MFVIHNPKTHKFWNRGKKTMFFASQKEAAEHAKAKDLDDFCFLEFNGIASDGMPLWGIDFADWILSFVDIKSSAPSTVTEIFFTQTACHFTIGRDTYTWFWDGRLFNDLDDVEYDRAAKELFLSLPGWEVAEELNRNQFEILVEMNNPRSFYFIN